MIFLLQAFLTFFILLPVYLMLGFLDSEMHYFGINPFHLVLGINASLATILTCGIIGLPIRFVSSLHHWWRTHYYIAYFLAAAGLTSAFLAYSPIFMAPGPVNIDGIEVIKELPNRYMISFGWILLGFGALHSYFPSKNFVR